MEGVDEMEVKEVGLDEVGVQEIMAVGKLHLQYTLQGCRRVMSTTIKHTHTHMHTIKG